MSAESKPGKSAKAAAQVTEAGANIDNIRDILFGAQMRQYDRRFQRLEELLTKECADIREDLKRRLEAIAADTRTELGALRERLAAESEERGSAAADLGQRITDLSADLRSRTARLEESFGQGLKELRQGLAEQGRSLGDDIRGRNEALSARLGSGLEGLRLDKVDRAELGALLNEVAVRLTEHLEPTATSEP
jgi:hypothetical protein